MPLKKAKGNMYQGWVTHTHSHLVGACPHACSYCYVQAMARRFPNLAERASGPVTLLYSELFVPYGHGKTIFVEHLNDLFAEAVPSAFIREILAHCHRCPRNTYVLQTKNPCRYAEFRQMIPANSILGTTIETNRHYGTIMAKSPTPARRYEAMVCLDWAKKFVTIEPILDFDLGPLVDWIRLIRPALVNIGADSKGRGLPEPSPAKVRALIEALKAAHLDVRLKSNLARLLPAGSR